MREQKRLLIYHLAFASLMVLVVMTAALGVVFFRLRHEIRLDVLAEPFLLSVLIALGCGLTVMVVGTTGILRTSRTLVDRLDESEERNRELLEATTDGVLDFDQHGTITALNPAAERAFGYTRRALLGQSVTKLVIGHSANGVQKPRHATPAVLEDLLRPCRGLLTQGQRQDGTMFPLELSIVEQGAGTDSRHFVAVVRDLTETYQQQRELAESEERFRVLSKASFEGIALFEGNEILDNNQALTSMLARGAATLRGEDLLDIFQPEQRETVQAALAAQEDQSAEVYALRSDGTTFPCEIAVKRIPYRGRSAGVIALRDISERKQVEGVIQQFQRSEAELAAIQKTAATYAHEINNPLTGVLGMLQMLMEEEPDRERLDMLNEALACSRRIKDVMSKLGQITSPKYRHYLRAENEIIDLGHEPLATDDRITTRQAS